MARNDGDVRRCRGGDTGGRNAARNGTETEGRRRERADGGHRALNDGVGNGGDLGDDEHPFRALDVPLGHLVCGYGAGVRDAGREGPESVPHVLQAPPTRHLLLTKEGRQDLMRLAREISVFFLAVFADLGELSLPFHDDAGAGILGLCASALQELDLFEGPKPLAVFVVYRADLLLSLGLGCDIATKLGEPVAKLELDTGRAHRLLGFLLDLPLCRSELSKRGGLVLRRARDVFPLGLFRGA